MHNTPTMIAMTISLKATCTATAITPKTITYENNIFLIVEDNGVGLFQVPSFHNLLFHSFFFSPFH